MSEIDDPSDDVMDSPGSALDENGSSGAMDLGSIDPTEGLEHELLRDDEALATETELLLRRATSIVESARTVPLSTSVMIDRDELLELLNHTISKFPEELRQARWLVKEREDFRAQGMREGEEIVNQARARAERMVQRTEVVKAAEKRARRIIDAAEADARRTRLEVEDFCDQKLAGFEIVLERTMRLVGAGREKLQGSVRTLADEKLENPDQTGSIEMTENVFDQDV